MSQPLSRAPMIGSGPRADPSAGGEERSAEHQGEHGSDPASAGSRAPAPRCRGGRHRRPRSASEAGRRHTGSGTRTTAAPVGSTMTRSAVRSGRSVGRSALRRRRGRHARVRSVGRRRRLRRHLRVDGRLGGPRDPCHRRGSRSGVDGRSRPSRHRRGTGLGDDRRLRSDRLGLCDERSRRLGRRRRRLGSSGTRRRLLGGRWRRRRRSGRRSWGGRRRGCRGRVGGTPRRKQAEWVDVGVLADPNAEMDVRNRMFGVARRPGICDRVSLRDDRSLPDAQRSEVRERRLVVRRR